MLKQRTSLLKSARAALRGSCDPGALGTLDVWDAHLARSGAELLEARLALVDELRPLVAAAYVSVAGGSLSAGVHAALTYRPSFELSEGLHDREALGELLLSELQRRRGEEL